MEGMAKRIGPVLVDEGEEGEEGGRRRDGEVGGREAIVNPVVVEVTLGSCASGGLVGVGAGAVELAAASAESPPTPASPSSSSPLLPSLSSLLLSPSSKSLCLPSLFPLLLTSPLAVPFPSIRNGLSPPRSSCDLLPLPPPLESSVLLEVEATGCSAVEYGVRSCCSGCRGVAVVEEAMAGR